MTSGVCREKKARLLPCCLWHVQAVFSVTPNTNPLFFSVTPNTANPLSLLSGLWEAEVGTEGCSFSRLLLVRQGGMCPTARSCPRSCLDGDPLPSAMRTNRCSHLPGVPPDHPHPPAPDGKSLPGSSGGLATSCPQYVMQVSSKDGQLLSSVVRTLAVQR